jgi:hypothetical protein
MNQQLLDELKSISDRSDTTKPLPVSAAPPLVKAFHRLAAKELDVALDFWAERHPALREALSRSRQRDLMPCETESEAEPSRERVE